MSIEHEIEQCKQDDYRDDEIRFLQDAKREAEREDAE